MNFNRKQLSNDQLLTLYKNILYPRIIEDKMLILLRQGKIGKWFSGIGQEAISVGVTMALLEDEYILPLHRNLGVFTTRKVPFKNYLHNGKVRNRALPKAATAVFTLVPTTTTLLV